MKKTLFIAFSAIGIVVASLLVVACSSDSNSPDVQANKVVQRVAEDTSNEDAWTDFYAEVEALNARYAVQSRMISLPQWGADLDMTKFKQLIVVEDAKGSQIGWDYAYNNSATTNNSLATATIVGALRSYEMYRYEPDTTTIDTTGTTITIINPNRIDNLSLITTPFVLIGQRHNQLLASLINSNYNSTGKSERQMFQDFVQRYEQLFTPMTNAYKQILLTQNVYTTRTPNLTDNVATANENFKTQTAQMSIATLHDYTDEYLNIVNATSLNAYDKMQMSLYASVSYYSGALWVVQ